MTTRNAQIDQYIEDNLDRYIDELVELCRQPSISARHEGINECAALVADLLRRHGFEAEVMASEGHPVVYGYAEGESPRTILCYNHYDVQPPEPLELWTTPPFEPSLRDGKLYARGVVDDKGEIIARLAALDAIRSVNGGKLPCTIKFAIEGEEEVGSPYVAGFVRDHTDLLAADASIWEGGGVSPEGRPGLALGYRGVLGVELFVETMTRDAHSGGAHVFPNAGWRLVRLLEALKDENEHIKITGFYDNVRPPSALDMELLAEQPTHEEMLRDLFGIKEFVLGRTGMALKEAVFQPTCNIQGITTGYQQAGMKTVIPAKASVKLDFRLVPDQEPDEIFAKLRAYLDEIGFADVEIARYGSMSPSKAEPDDPFVQLTIRTGEDVYGLPAQVTTLGGGSTPVYAFAGPLGNIPVVSAGIGYWDSRGHAPDENIRIEDFVTGTRHIARIIDGFSGLFE
ncbi:MAG: M20/M25/M40 family metallo-hydrolase [Caldilineaceae bacterium]